MITTEQVTQLKELVAAANTILVIVGAEPTLDQAASALALHSSLQAQGKPVTLLSPYSLDDHFPDLIGADHFQQQLGNKDLSVSFDYEAEAVDKVSYHIDEQNQKFYLVIKPQKGHPPLDTQTMEFTYTGAEADLIFLVGVHSLEELEHLYSGYEQLYQDTTIVTFHTFEPAFGSVKLNASGYSSLSEAMTSLVLNLETTPTADVATSLLSAIESATDNFKSLTTTAETFETVAALLRSGARRTRRSQPSSPSMALTASPPNTPGSRTLSPTQSAGGASFAAAMGKSNQKNGVVSEAKPVKPKTTKVGSLKHEPSEFGPGGGG